MGVAPKLAGEPTPKPDAGRPFPALPGVPSDFPEKFPRRPGDANGPRGMGVPKAPGVLGFAIGGRLVAGWAGRDEGVDILAEDRGEYVGGRSWLVVMMVRILSHWVVGAESFKCSKVVLKPVSNVLAVRRF